MHLTDFLKRVSQKNQKQHISKRVYDKVIKEFLASIQQELAAGRKVQFLGFGTFYMRTHRAGKGRNFKTGKLVEYKAVRVPVFRPGSLLRQAVRRKK